MAPEKGIARRERGELASQMEPWDSFREMERMMRDFFVSPLTALRGPRWLPELATRFVPEVDLRETDQHFIISATVPGMSKDDIDIDVTKDTITISGERKIHEEKPGERYHFRQQGYGAFRVSYALPADVKPEDVKATYKNGLLEIELPKTQVAEAHKVKVEES